MCDAFWLPAFESDFDPDEVLGAGGAWLRDAEYPGGPVIALHAAKMTDNRPSLASLASRFSVVAPTTGNRGYGGSYAVLAVWPSKRSMEVAEEMASPNGGLCVIPYLDKEWRSWIAAHRAVDLLKPNDEPGTLNLPVEVRKTLDLITLFDGHNGFGSAEGKIDAIRDLPAMVADGHRPAPADVEAYADASTDVIRGGGQPPRLLRGHPRRKEVPRLSRPHDLSNARRRSSSVRGMFSELPYLRRCAYHLGGHTR